MNLIECDLDKDPQYKAISYCWGDQEQTRPALCNSRLLSVDILQARIWPFVIANHWSKLLQRTHARRFPVFYMFLVVVGILLLQIMNLPWASFSSAVEFGSISNTVLVRTSDGYIAFVPPISRVGDAIALVKCSGVPLILRRSDAKNWELVGAAEVPGLMQGERWGEEKCGTISIV